MVDVSEIFNRLNNIDEVSDIFNRFDNIVDVSDILRLFDNIVEVSEILNRFDNIVDVSEILKRFDNILDVSEIFNLRLILPFKIFALSTNDVLIFVESLNIFNLMTLILSSNAPSVAPANKSILFERETVSLPILLSNIKLVSFF